MEEALDLSFDRLIMMMMMMMMISSRVGKIRFKYNVVSFSSCGPESLTAKRQVPNEIRNEDGGSRSLRKFSEHLRLQNLSSGNYEDVDEFLNFVRDVSAPNHVYTKGLQH